MPKQQKPKSEIRVNITGDVSGQIVVGNHNRVVKNVNQSSANSERLSELHRLLAELKSHVQAEAPDDKKKEAFKRVAELEQAVSEKKPDPAAIEYAKNWFDRNLPNLAEVVAKITDEFKKRFL